MKQHGKVLALDFGTKRIGYAVSDVSQTMAFPRETLAAKPLPQFLETLRKIIQEERIVKIVIGLPLDSEQEEGEAAAAARKFGEMLARECMIPVAWVDESGSTDEALRKIPFRRDRRKKGFRDAIAAQIILERYLGA